MISILIFYLMMTTMPIVFFLEKETKLPDVLFLDINMPRKNGFASLGQIKRSTDIQDIILEK